MNRAFSRQALSHKEQALGLLTLTIEWFVDVYATPEELGTFTDRRPDYDAYYVDVGSGLLFGPVVTQLDHDNEDHPLEERWGKIISVKPLEDDDLVLVEGRRVLADLGRANLRERVRYFIPPLDIYRGTPEPELLRYIAQDYQRLADYYKEYWYYQECVVTVSVHGVEAGSASLCNIESDADTYHPVVEKELTKEALRDCDPEVLRTQAVALSTAAATLGETLATLEKTP